MSNLRRSAFNIGGTTVYFAVQLVLSVLVARFLGFTGAGVNSLALTLSYLFAPIAMYGVRGFQVSDVSGEFSDADYTSLRLATTAAAVALFAAVLPFMRVSAAVVLCSISYMAIRVFESFADLYFGFFQKRDRYDAIFASYLLKSVATLGVTVAALFFTKDVVVVVAMTAVSFALAFFGYDVRVARPERFRRPDPARLKSLLKKCLPLMAYGFVMPYVNFIVRYVVERVEGTEILGYYASIAILQSVLSTLTSAVWLVYIPTFAVLHREGDTARMRGLLVRILLGLLALSAAAVVGTALLGGPVLEIVYGVGIRPYEYLLMPVVVVSLFVSGVVLFNSILIAIGKNTVMLVANILGALAITAVSYPLVTSFGPNGANGAMLVGVAVQLLLTFIPVFRAVRTPRRATA
jgi:O-antigen/teichoic acid export membrane protein